jgi:hypothetical protein
MTEESSTATIFVYLPDEAVDVWRPVQARHLNGDCYQITSANHAVEIERWQFNTGDIVRCRLQALHGGETLVAYELVPRSV